MPPLTASRAAVFAPAARLLELPAGHDCGVMKEPTSDMAALSTLAASTSPRSRTHTAHVVAADRGRPSLCSP
eukprot:2345795-Prymnesium_polylepis.1